MCQVRNRNLLKSHVIEICFNKSVVNQGVGVVDLLQCAVAVVNPTDRKLVNLNIGHFTLVTQSRVKSNKSEIFWPNVADKAANWP